MAQFFFFRIWLSMLIVMNPNSFETSDTRLDSKYRIDETTLNENSIVWTRLRVPFWISSLGPVSPFLFEYFVIYLILCTFEYKPSLNICNVTFTFHIKNIIYIIQKCSNSLLSVLLAKGVVIFTNLICDI